MYRFVKVSSSTKMKRKTKARAMNAGRRRSVGGPIVRKRSSWMRKILTSSEKPFLIGNATRPQHRQVDTLCFVALHR
jgi:hypothetical protein